MKITELGCAGHHIMADRCRWRRHTQVGDRYRVSTVGDLYLNNERETVNASSFFETLVFQTHSDQDDFNEGCGCHSVTSWCQIEGCHYDTAGEAQEGHEAMVRKYAAMAEQEAA